ncbi:MAG TPA: platelet-activating factor acetylhydrolase IB subunit [Planctomycetaceae bacterium]|nr:platelet-activating factor acetylhydrolase IB subunit [Planctomycetaceae bacterium]
MPNSHRWLWSLILCGMTLPVFAQDAPKENDAIKPVPRDGNWTKRQELLNSRVKDGKADLLFIGDSITQAWEGPGKDAWAKHFAPRNAVNLGIGGDRTQHVLWRLDNGNINDIKPKLAVVMIGTNNARSNKPEETVAGVTAIVTKLREKLPETKILLLAIFPRGADKDDQLRQTNNKVNEQIAKLADGKMVEYLDIGPKFLAEDGTLSKDIMPDLLHLSVKGYEIWAEAIEPHVARMMGS